MRRTSMYAVAIGVVVVAAIVLLGNSAGFWGTPDPNQPTSTATVGERREAPDTGVGGVPTGGSGQPAASSQIPPTDTGASAGPGPAEGRGPAPAAIRGMEPGDPPAPDPMRGPNPANPNLPEPPGRAPASEAEPSGAAIESLTGDRPSPIPDRPGARTD